MLCPLCPGLPAPEHIVTHTLESHPQEVQAMGERIWQRQQQKNDCDLFSLINSIQERGLVQLAMAIKNAGVFSAECSPLAAAALVQETQNGRMSLFLYPNARVYAMAHTVAPAELKPVFAKDLTTVGSAEKIARQEIRATTYYVPVMVCEQGRFPGAIPMCVRVVTNQDDKNSCRIWPVHVE